MTHKDLTQILLEKHGDQVRRAIPDFMLEKMGFAPKDFQREREKILRQTLRRFMLHLESHFLMGGFNIEVNNSQQEVAFRLVWRQRTDYSQFDQP